MAPFVRVSSFLVLASFRALASTLTEYRWNAAGPLSAQARTQCLDPFSPATEGILSKELWTYPLRCVSSKQSPAGESKPAYCLFTSAPLRGYSGISIITTPEIAADAFSSDGLKDSYDFWRWEERVSNLGPIWDAQGPSYAVKDIPGKGKGVVARRDIRIGEVFMLDYPVILAHRGLLDSLGPDYRQKFFTAAIEQLPETAREKVMALARISADKSNYAEDILTTNACSVFLGGTESHVGLFPEVSRINHACNASAFFRFSQRTFTMEVIAYRDIQEGEEISINYAYLGMPYDVRQRFLKDTWGFHCSCPMCSSSPAERETSDKRRMEIARSRDEMHEAQRVGNLDQAIGSANKLIELSEMEGLSPLAAGFHQTLAQLHLDKDEISLSRRHNQEALKLLLAFRGADSFQVASNHRLMRDIERAEARMTESS